MRAITCLVFAIFIIAAKGSMLKCGEDIIVRRGEVKTLRFWSTDDELMKVEMVPVREQSDASALLAIFKDSYNKRPNIFASRVDSVSSKDSLRGTYPEEETLYRIDDKILENFNNHLLSRTEILDTSGNETGLPVDEYDESFPNNTNSTDIIDDEHLIQVDDYGQNDYTNEERPKEHQEYEEYEDYKDGTKIDSYDVEDHPKEEENNKYESIKGNFTDEGFVDDILITEYDSNYKINPEDSEIMTSTVRESDLVTTTEDSTTLVTIFDDNFVNEVEKIENETEDNLVDLSTTEPAKNTEFSSTEKITTQDSSQIDIDILNYSSTDNILEEDSNYELRNEFTDSYITTEGSVEIIMSTQPTMATESFTNEIEVTTEVESSTLMTDEDSNIERNEELIDTDEEKLIQNQDLFSSNPFEDYLNSKTEQNDDTNISLMEDETTNKYTTSSSQIKSLDKVESTVPENAHSTVVYDFDDENFTTEQTLKIEDTSKKISTKTIIPDETEKEHVFDQDKSHILFDETGKIKPTVRKEDLNDIISELKSQEALLSQPSSKDGSVHGLSMKDNESVDIKLNILKNIIKGITSEIASNEKTISHAEREDNMQQTHLIYPEEGFEYADNDNLEALSAKLDDLKSHVAEEVSKGKIHIQDNFKQKESSMFIFPKTDLVASREQLQDKNEIVLANINNEVLQESSIKNNDNSKNTNDDKGIKDDVKETTTTSSPNSSPTTDGAADLQLAENDIVIEKDNINKEMENEKSEVFLEETPKKAIDINSNIDKTSFEELYFPINFLGAHDSNADQEEENITDQTIFTEQTPFSKDDNEHIESTVSDIKDFTLIYESHISTQNPEDNFVKSMRKDIIENDITTISNTEINTETSTNEISTITEIPEVIEVMNEDSLFSKETGSDNVVSLLRNSQTNDDIDDIETEGPHEENSILLPVALFNSKTEQVPHLFSEQKADNQVLINEQGSKVVIIKPNSDILKAKTDHDSPSLTLNTETGNYEVEIESTTLADVDYTDVEVADDGLNENTEQDSTTTVPDVEQISQDAQFEKTSNNPETRTEDYIPFGLTNENDPLSTSNPSQHALIDTSLDQNEDYNEQDKNFDESKVFKTAAAAIIDNNDNYDNYDNIYEFPKRNKETSYDNYQEYEDEFSNSEIYDETDSEKLERKINTRLSNSEISEDYLANHRISEPLPYLLQTRKGFVDADAPFIRAGSVQHRSDDSQQSFGEDSPFYIKLPGSKNAVPVFLQYEPVKVKYVNADKFFKKKPIADEEDINEGEMNNDLSSSFYKETLKDKNNIKDKPSVTLEQIANSQMNVDFHMRPDPFYVMDAPNLGNEKGKFNAENNEVDSLTINVEGKLGVQKDGGVSSVITGDKPIYPGEYFIKNPDNSYSSSDTSSLTNPVFTLGSKVTLPPREPGVLQYTPFPLTTNPPKIHTPNEAENLIESDDLNTLQNGSIEMLIANDTEQKYNYSTENPPSIEYSPIPSIDYPDSYGPFEYADPSYTENNDSKFYDDGENEFSSKYPEKAFITDVKKDKLVGDPMKKNSDFDIVALANFLHQNQKVWSNPKATPIPEGGLWRSSSWDDVVHSSEQTNDSPAALQLASPWAAASEGLGEERFYSAFHSPEEVPGIDPAFFSYRKMPKNIKDAKPAKETLLSRESRSLNSQLEGIVRFIETLPMYMQNALVNPILSETKRIRRSSNSATSAGEHVYCEWNIKTEPGLYLLVTFHNLSAPYTVDCFGAYIEVERENNGYDARWCGNRATVAGTRPHVIFAKSEVRITVYDNGDAAKTFPTGFEADIEVIDLFDSEDYKHFMEKKATPKIRKLMEG